MHFQTLKLENLILIWLQGFILILAAVDSTKRMSILGFFILHQISINNLSPKKVTQCPQLFIAFCSLFAYMELILQLY